jgi:iron(III) transport system ATP-binding protein
MVAIHIENLSKYFAPAAPPAVDNVSLTIPTGSLFFLLGPSGCGKTTLLRMIAGFTFPSSGRIRFDQQDMSMVPPHLRDTGMVFQSYALWPHMTVADNIAFGLDVRKLKNPERKNRIAQALALVQMEQYADRKPNQLSGGQQQRVALARALAIRPKCLLLDEPLSNLDAKLRLDMRSEIRRIVKQSGITTIYVTHDQKEALSMADTIAVMRAGKLEQFGAPADLYRHPATRFVANFIGESNFLGGTIESVNGSGVRVNTPAGPILAAPSRAKVFSVGQKVSVAFRPEAVAIVDAKNGSANSQPAGADVNRLSGTRVSATYLGEMAEHLIAIPGAADPIKAYQINPGGIPSHAGDAVTVVIPAEHVIVVEDEA